MLVIITSGSIINLTKNKQNKVVWQEVTRTLLFFKIAIPLALLSSLFLYNSTVTSYHQNTYLVVLGILFVIIGLYFRWEAIRKLSGMFTVKISIVENHELLSTGVFKYVRHPSYLGMV
ncbi:protein-S-isoprenylcysteine O-methyltransferase, partial [Flavobacteriales bacterium]|nr:protein-S-isoprenylcysteine O-methyltransferase [Flavobacteriales bacterium]